MKHFKYYTKEDILSLTRLRKFETKIGERLKPSGGQEDWQQALAASSAHYVVLGIPEDIGVRANDGVGGADTAWLSFLTAFLNIQSNEFLEGNDIMLMGHFDFGDIKYLIENNALNEPERIDAYRHAVGTIDEEVEQVIKAITACGKMPIVVGGGHNNSYPVIKGAAKGLHKAGILPLAQINCINVDAHADYRPAEGRHSGNGFRYAADDGYLGKYCIVGLHENYLPQNVLLDIHNNPFIDYISYEEIFISERKNYIQAIAHATGFTENTYTGIELDLDCIERTLSSAATPCGITALQARQYVSFTATDAKPAYLHICEGAAQLNDGRKDESTGKLISFLISDFIKAHQQR